MVIMSILLYVYRHLMYLRLPMMTSMNSSMVQSQRIRTSQLDILYCLRMSQASFCGSGPKWVSGTVLLNLTPPAFFLVMVTSGGDLLRRMPTDSSSPGGEHV